MDNPTFILNKSINVIEIAFKVSRLVYLIIELDYATIYIEQLLPSRKDRGRYKVLANHKPEFCYKCYFDSQDGFPRYYFDFQCLMSEVKSLIIDKSLIVEDVLIYSDPNSDKSESMKKILREYEENFTGSKK